MSERCENSVSNRSLLANANITEIKVASVREALAEYQKICKQSQAESEQLTALNQLLRSLSKTENPNQEKIAQYRADAERCVRNISNYDKRLFQLESSISLQPLLETLKAKAYREAEERGSKALQEYYQEEEKKQEQIVKEWREKRQIAEQKVRQKQISTTEAEVKADATPTKTKKAYKSWLNDFWDWLEDVFESLGCFGPLILCFLMLCLAIPFFVFLGYLFGISPMWGYILVFGGIGCPLYFLTRKRWVFWLYLAIVVALFFCLLSMQQFA